MAGSSGQLHEDPSQLGVPIIERHRAIVSLMEELEAVDWYDQRVGATTDEELRAVLQYNRDEDKEHGAMTLEWLRRHDPALDRQLRHYLCSEGSIVTEEALAGTPDRSAGQATPTIAALGIGRLGGKGSL